MATCYHGLRSMLLLVCAAAWSAIAMGPALAEDWQTGDAFRRQLAQPAAASWSGQHLREALAALGEANAVAMFLDRRVDPDQLIEFSASGMSLDALLHKLSASLELGVSYVDSVIYIGPPETAARLATLAEMRFDQSQRQVARLRLWLTQRSPLTWSQLSEPRQLLQQMADAAGITIEGLELVPHDLWAAGSWPAVPHTHQLTLLLAGFDLHFEPAAGEAAIRLVPMPREASLQRTYDVRGNATAKAAELRAAFPDTQIEVAGRSIRVVGSAEQHLAIRDALQGTPRRGTTTEEPTTTYSLTVTAPLGAILKELAKQDQLVLEIDDQAAEKIGTQIDVNVKNVTLRKFLDEITVQAGVKYELQGKTLRILP